MDLLVTATGKAKKQLNRTGVVRVIPHLTFTSVGGSTDGRTAKTNFFIDLKKKSVIAKHHPGDPGYGGDKQTFGPGH